MATLRVPREDAGRLIAELRRLGLLDTRRRPAEDGASVLVPVREAPPPSTLQEFRAEAVDAVLTEIPRPRSPMDAVREAAAAIPGVDLAALPSRWELVGDVLILRLSPAVRAHAERLAPIYGRVLRAKTVVEDVGGIRGEWRVPQVRRLWGDGSETEHLENGIRFRLDVTKVMFSSGNLDERIRMAGVPRPGETIVDLFAGIGYFAVPMAVHARPARVVACEANPDAFRFLMENARINRASQVEARLGDCRKVAPAGVADRVVMGYLEAVRFLGPAFRAARDRCTIHLHGIVRDRWVPRPPLMQTLYMEAARHGFVVSSVRLRKVKSFGPRTWHAVVDADVARA